MFASLSALEKRALAFSLLATVLVSTSFIVSASIANDLDSVVLTLFRFALGAVLFLPILLWKHGFTWPSWSDLARYATISAALVAFFWGMFEALRTTSPLNTATIFTLMPTIGAGLAAVMLKQKLKKNSLVALGLGMIGAIWVIFRGNFTDLAALELNRGDAIFLAATFAMAIYGPLINFLHRGEPMPQMTFWILTTGSFWLLLLSASSLGDVDWAGITPKVYLSVLYLASFTTVVTFFIFQWSTLIIGPTKVLSFTYLNPIFVLVIGLLLGADAPPVMIYPGLVLTVGATLMLMRAPGHAPKPAPATSPASTEDQA